MIEGRRKGKVLKKICQLLATFIVSPLIALYWILALLLSRDPLLSSFSQLLSILPGKVGVYLRAGFYRFALSSCSPDAVISFATLLSQYDTDIAKGVYIGPQCNIGKCEIGKETLLGSGVHIMSGKSQHHFARLDIPIKNQGGIFEKIKIGEGCWLGNGSLIMANVGSGVIVAAGSVVVDDVPENSIVAGNPAKVIKNRS